MGYFVGWILLSIVIGAIGSNRKIGFMESLLWSLFLSPLIGLIVTVSSKTIESDEREKETMRNSEVQTKVLKDLARTNYIDELFKLKSLLDSGVLTQKEFDIEKQRLDSLKDLSERTFIGFYISQNSKYVDKITYSIDRLKYHIPKTKKESSQMFEIFDEESIRLTVRPKSMLLPERHFIIPVISHNTVHYNIDDILAGKVV